MTEPATYLSFLVRLWHETGSEGAGWQGEVEHIQSGQRWTFSSLDELASILRQMTENPQPLGRSTEK